MSNPFKSAKFKKLQNEWYDKLEKSGFEDIEERNSHHEMLKRWHSFDFPKKDQEKVEQQRQYFLDAAWFLTHFKGFKRFERRVWTLHTDGLSLREIAARLKVNKDKVHAIVKNLQGKMSLEKKICDGTTY